MAISRNKKTVSERKIPLRDGVEKKKSVREERPRRKDLPGTVFEKKNHVKPRPKKRKPKRPLRKGSKN